METNLPAQTIYSPYQSIKAADSAPPGVMTGGKAQKDLKLFKVAQLGFLQIQGTVYLSTAVKEKHCRGCDLRVKIPYLLCPGVSTDMCFSAHLPWEKWKGLSQLSKDFQISVLFFILKLSKTLDTWMNNQCVFSPYLLQFSKLLSFPCRRSVTALVCSACVFRAV